MVDFLDFCKDDIIWFTMTVIKASLLAFTWFGRARQYEAKDVKNWIGMILMTVHIIIEALLVQLAFFC
jgi:uncharacterized membrane protein